MGCASTKSGVAAAAAAPTAAACDAKHAETLLVSPRRRDAEGKKQLDADGLVLQSALEAEDEPEPEVEVAIPTSPNTAEESGRQPEPERRNMLDRAHWPESPASALSCAVARAATTDEQKEAAPDSAKADEEDSWLFNGCCRPETSQNELSVSAKLRRGVPKSYVRKCSRLR